MAATRVLGGRYRLVERLGKGGMSVVWRAYDEALGRPVAIKLLTARYLAHPSSRGRILTEAQAAARMSHPHITSVHDYGEAPTGSGGRMPYVVMELLSGSTLAERLRTGPLPVRTALQVCAQVASALAAAHGSGLVHRDVKPANVVLTPTGAKVLDFGLAAATGAPDEFRSGGEVWGTPAYLAPERLTAGEVVPASDVYALGLLLYGCLTGRKPWRAETVDQLLDAHRYETPEPLPPSLGLPADVTALCHRCLAKEPRDRPAAHEAARVLAEAVGWRVSDTAPPWPVTPVMRSAVPVALPAPAGPDADAFPTGPTVMSGRRRAGAARLRALALSGSAAAVLASVSAGLWVVDPELGGYSALDAGGGGLGAAVWSTTPAGDPEPAGPAREPAPGDSGGGGTDPVPAGGSGAGSASGAGSGSGSDRSGGSAPASPPATGAEPPSDPPSSDPPSSDPPSSDPPSSDPPSSDPPSGDPPSEGSPEEEEDADPGSGSPASVEQGWVTVAGTVVARCVGSTATLLSWQLLPGVTLGTVDPGPGPEVSIVLNLLVARVSVVVHCEAGVPVAAIQLS